MPDKQYRDRAEVAREVRARFKFVNPETLNDAIEDIIDAFCEYESELLHLRADLANTELRIAELIMET